MLLNRLRYCRYIVLCLFVICGKANAQKSIDDSIIIAVEPGYDSVSKFHRDLFGENYRKLWATPVKLKIFHIEKEKGGLTITGQGGGKQTRSLKLKDKDGYEWALRTVQKYPERALPKNLRKTIVRDILQDEVSTSHPFSALVVPPLAQVLGIPHSNPQIVYVADDPALGKYREEYGNHVFLFEERDPLDIENTDNTVKAEKKLEDDNDNRVDQKMILRARLLDFIIGDWDRHEDQWRWDKEKDDTGIVYKPIPRDRDKVFYTTSGLFPFVLSHQYLKTQLQPYGGKIRSIEAWNYNARFFDRYFLTQLNKEDWLAEIAFVQSKITYKVIEDAMRLMPAVIYNKSAAHIIKAMEQRRDRLQHEGMDYYHFLAKTVDIPATDKKEYFDIVGKPDSSLDITVKKINKSGQLEQTIYHRVFYPDVTKEVRLYGLGGKDVFNVTGAYSGVKLRMIGGDGIDSFYVDKNLHNRHNLYVYDRKDQPNAIPSVKDAKVRLSADTSVNFFDRQNFRYESTSPVVLAKYNQDEGLVLVGGITIERQGFRQYPYRFRQSFLGGYSLGRNSFVFSYLGDFKKAINNNDIYVSVISKGPNNVANFFGIGNNTTFPNKDPLDIEYFRNHFNTINADGRLLHTYNNWQLSAGVTSQFYYANQSPNANHYLGLYNLQNPNEKVFQSKLYAGGIVGAKYDNRNKANNSTKGYYFNTTVNTVTGLVNTNKTYTQLQSEIRGYYNPDRDSILIIAGRVGFGTIFGNAEFFQQSRIGGPDNLHGFNTNRFTGRTMVYNNIELRLKLFDFNSYLFPGSFGVIGFNDVGRVWADGESSSKWHDGYGGGVFVAPAQILVIQAQVGFSNERTLTYVSFGYRF